MAMVIFSMLLSGFGYGLISYQKQQKYKITKFRMAAIQKAIDEFLEINGRLPCVARLDRGPDQPNFGFEAVNVTAGATTCRFAIPGTILYNPNIAGPSVGGPNNTLWVRTGSVPVRSLNLPDEYILDGWGSRFTYVVSERESSESAPGVSMYVENAGSINVVDSNGNSVIDQSNPKFAGFNNFAEYVLISHGEDRKGAVALSNNSMPPSTIVNCPTIAAETQAENCRNTTANPNIVVSDVISDGDYDDIVVYKAGANLNKTLPTGAVVGFDQFFNESVGAGTRAFDADGGTNNGVSPAAVSTVNFTCPVGWQPFVPAQGRFIIGATSGSTFERVQRHGSLSASATTRNYSNLGKSGEAANVITPKYVTTFFCEKQE